MPNQQKKLVRQPKSLRYTYSIQHPDQQELFQEACELQYSL